MEQAVMIRKLQNKLEKLYTEKEELAAQLTVLQQQAPSLEHLMQVRHDVRAQYNSIIGLIQLGRTKEIERYVRSIYHDLASIDDFPPGISPVLSVVIGQIKKEARESGIDFEYHVTSKDLGLEPKDITCLYFNVLENALEGARHSGVKTPYMDLEVSRKGEMIYIRCINSVDSAKLIKRGKWYETTKADKENHGLGMEIIENTLKHYCGKMEMIVEEECFVWTGQYECRKKV